MSLHDDYARLTPFEIAFPDAASVEALSAVLREGASDVPPPEVFVCLPAVVAFVREMAGPEAAPGLLHHYGLLAFHSVHFLRAGRPLYLLDAAAARKIVAGAPDAVPELPHTAGYMQLPQHLFWVDGLGGPRPESLDGVFWAESSQGTLHGLAITGLRPDRPGFGAVALPEAPVSEASMWVHVTVRETAEDFSTSLPGGDLDRLYAVEMAGELLKLMGRFFAYVAGTRSSLTEIQADVAAAAGAPRPSALPYTLVRSAA
jgi:hypothetical protein